MAYAKVTTQFTDGSIVVVEVGDENLAHPDFQDEIVARVVKLYEDVVDDDDAEVTDE